MENDQRRGFCECLVLAAELALEVLDALRAGDRGADLLRPAKPCQRLLPPLLEQRGGNPLAAQQYADLALR